MGLVFASCDSGNSGGGGNTVVFDREITISDVIHLSSDVVTVKVAADYSLQENEVLVSADIVDGSATIELPATIEAENLELLLYGIPADARLSDRNTKAVFIDFGGYDSSDEHIAIFTLQNATAEADLIYADRPCTITRNAVYENDGEEYTTTINLNLVAGYNWIKHTYMDNTDIWVNGAPDGAEWVCHDIVY